MTDDQPFDLDRYRAKRLEQMTAAAEQRVTAHQHKSFNEYRRERYQELQTFATNRRKIYLDTKFWIWLREPKASPNPAAMATLWDRLRDGASEGRFCCPLVIQCSSKRQKFLH